MACKQRTQHVALHLTHWQPPTRFNSALTSVAEAMTAASMSAPCGLAAASVTSATASWMPKPARGVQGVVREGRRGAALNPDHTAIPHRSPPALRLVAASQAARHAIPLTGEEGHEGAAQVGHQVHRQQYRKVAPAGVGQRHNQGACGGRDRRGAGRAASQSFQGLVGGGVFETPSCRWWAAAAAAAVGAAQAAAVQPAKEASDRRVPPSMA